MASQVGLMGDVRAPGLRASNVEMDGSWDGQLFGTDAGRCESDGLGSRRSFSATDISSSTAQRTARRSAMKQGTRGTSRVSKASRVTGGMAMESMGPMGFEGSD